MASVNIVLRKEVKKDGTSPLAIRITKDRKTSYIYLDYSVRAEDWDKSKQKVKKSHKNSERLNHYLDAKKVEAKNESIELETNQKNISAQAVRKKIKPSTHGSVFAQCQLYIDRLKQDGKYNRYSADKPRVERLKEFLERDIPFSELSISLIKRYKAWLKSTRKMSERTAVNHLVVLRSLFSQAIAEKVCDPKYYPFGKEKIQIKFPESIKIGGSIDDLRLLENADFSNNPSFNHARNLWLFSFYFAGMRVSDVFRLKWQDFQNDRLYYSMGKNNKGDSLKVPEKAHKILDQYKPTKDSTNLVFPELKELPDSTDSFQVQQRIKTKLKVVNDNLGELAKEIGITKKLTMHISRHTFGNISGDRIPVQMLQKLYRHSHISTTIGYQSSFINQSADDALDAVIGASK